jgi:hypothetical protein
MLANVEVTGKPGIAKIFHAMAARVRLLTGLYGQETHMLTAVKKRTPRLCVF